MKSGFKVLKQIRMSKSKHVRVLYCFHTLKCTFKHIQTHPGNVQCTKCANKCKMSGMCQLFGSTLDFPRLSDIFTNVGQKKLFKDIMQLAGDVLQEVVCLINYFSSSRIIEIMSCLNSSCQEAKPIKNSAYGRQRISRPMRIVGPIQLWRGGCMKKKKK